MSPATNSFGDTIPIPEIRLYGANVAPDLTGDAQVGTHVFTFKACSSTFRGLYCEPPP
jgi:hypothetical protein